MDAVFFSIKQGHLSAGRFCRRLLAGVGLTPARFDLMVAIGEHGATQSSVRRALAVARSTLSELVEAVVGCNLVRKTRAVDRRTWSLQLTARGKELLARAYGHWINEGIVPLSIDCAMSSGQPEARTEDTRFTLIEVLLGLCATFGREVPPDLYPWHPDDYLGAFVEPGEPSDGVPFVG